MKPTPDLTPENFIESLESLGSKDDDDKPDWRKRPSRKTVAESKATKALAAEMQQLGAFVFKIHGGAVQKAGMPDLLVLHNGRALFVEMKVGSNPQSKLQLERQKEILYRGIDSVVVRCNKGVWRLEPWERANGQSMPPSEFTEARHMAHWLLEELE